MPRPASLALMVTLAVARIYCQDHPLLQAAAKGDAAGVATALRAGAPELVRAAALRKAAAEGYVTVVERLVKLGVPVDATQRDQQGTPLVAAVDQLTERYDVVRALLSLGANPNTPGPDGRTPLMIAARQGHARITDALIAARADVNAKTTIGVTALMIAEMWNKPLVTVLRRAGATGGLETLPGGLGQRVEALQGSGPDVGDAYRVLQAMGRQAAPVVPYLTILPMLSRGKAVLPYVWPFEVDLPTDMLRAAESGDLEKWRLLNDIYTVQRSRGTPTEVRDASGRTALMLALGNGHSTLATEIAQLRGFPYHRDREGLTAIQLAARNGHIGAVERVLAPLPSVTMALASANAAHTIRYCAVSNGDINHLIAALETSPPVAARVMISGRTYRLAPSARSLIDVGPVGQGASVVTVTPAGSTLLGLTLYTPRGEMVEANGWRNAVGLFQGLSPCEPLGSWSPEPAPGGERAIARVAIAVAVVFVLAVFGGMALYLRKFVRYRKPFETVEA